MMPPSSEWTPLIAANATFALNPALCFLRVRFMSCSRALPRFLGAGLHLSHLSHFRGPAQYASVGTKIMALIDSDSYRVTAYFEETKILAMHPGEEAKIYLLDGSSALRGHVQSIARGITDRDNTGGPELLVNPNPTFEWVRLAQRIPVRIHIDEVPEGVLISSGMTCTVVLEMPPRQWAVLARLREWRAAAP